MLGKKGQIENWLMLLLVVGIIIIVGGLTAFFLNERMSTKQEAFTKDVSNAEASYSTRAILNYELENGYKTYDLVIEMTNQGKYDELAGFLHGVIRNYYYTNSTDKWILGINNHCYIVPTQGFFDYDGYEPPTSVIHTRMGRGMSLELPQPTSAAESCSNYVSIPRVTIPNPSGENIKIFIKPRRPIDLKEVDRLAWGSRADELQGYNLNELQSNSCTGDELVRIQGIPNIICDESVTDFGKICAANPDLVLQLRKISRDVLQEEDWTFHITQALRSYEIQDSLYQCFITQTHNGEEKECAEACDPSKRCCPHMTGGAVDIVLLDKEGNNLNEARLTPLMCNYGFVRYNKEAWHFEYGTWRWEEAESQRTVKGKGEPCVY